MTITHTLSLKFSSVLCETHIGTLSTSDIMGRGHGTEARDRRRFPESGPWTAQSLSKAAFQCNLACVDWVITVHSVLLLSIFS